MNRTTIALLLLLSVVVLLANARERKKDDRNALYQRGKGGLSRGYQSSGKNVGRANLRTSDAYVRKNSQGSRRYRKKKGRKHRKRPYSVNSGVRKPSSGGVYRKKYNRNGRTNLRTGYGNRNQQWNSYESRQGKRGKRLYILPNRRFNYGPRQFNGAG